MTGGILGPHPGIEPISGALKVQSLNHWTTGGVPEDFFNRMLNCLSERSNHFVVFFFSCFD